MAEQNYTGEYYLRGVMETGCGLKINEDHTFEFFYSYGALDRHGYGGWKETGANTIELNTAYKNAEPFKVVLEEKRNINGIQLIVKNFDPLFYKNSKAIVLDNGREEEQLADSKGIFHFKSSKAEEIIIVCLFYFDNPGSIIPSNSENNYFELEVNQNLLLVQFKNATYRFEDNTLKGNLHLLDDVKEYTFEK